MRELQKKRNIIYFLICNSLMHDLLMLDTLTVLAESIDIVTILGLQEVIKKGQEERVKR